MPTMSAPTSTMAPPPPGENTQLVDIEQPHKHDVLCGRGVTTNRFPGNESFRALVSLNKELYVTSTKRQKMSISRSIVEAVRSLKPPGRFLEKNPVTGLWSDIGDRKAIEKTSQALRDGAAGLRKELTQDLGDPEFLSAVFEVDAANSSRSKSKAASPTVKDKDKPVKPKPAKKGHRRTRSNPSATAKAAGKTLKKQKSAVETRDRSPSRGSSLPPRTPLSPASPGSSHQGAHMTSPPRHEWHYPPGHPVRHYPPSEGGGPPPLLYKPGRPYQRAHSYHMTPPPPPHHGAPPHPHSWSHGPPHPRYPPGPPSPQTVVHTPQSPLPPGRHQLTPNGCISKPPLSPRSSHPPPRWSPRHFPRHSYPPPPHDYVPPPGGRPPHHHPDYPHGPPPPDYARGPPPEYWSPPPDHHRGGPFYPGGRGRPGGHPRDYYPEYAPPHPSHRKGPEGLDVPALGGEPEYRHGHRDPYHRHYRPPSPSAEEAEMSREFTPPATPSRPRRGKPHSSSISSSMDSSTRSKSMAEESRSSTRKPPAHNDRMSDISEGTRSTASEMVVSVSHGGRNGDVKKHKGHEKADQASSNIQQEKDDATQKTVLSSASVAEVEGRAEGSQRGGQTKDDGNNDVVMKDNHTASASSPRGKNKAGEKPLSLSLKGEVHVISVVHHEVQATSSGEREESIEFMLRQDPTADDYSLSPLPFEREDPASLMELPDDILHMPISSCGPHDD